MLPADSIAVNATPPSPPSPPSPPFNCTENVSVAVELSSVDVAITVTSTEPVALLFGVSTRLPFPSNDAASFAGSELET